MSFAAPVWLAIAGLVAAGVVVAHLITTSQPRHDVLPTVRFIPQTAPLTVTRTRRPTDLLLLALRLLAVALIGLALAGAHVTRSAVPGVFVVDVSPAVADTAEIADSLRALGAADAAVIMFGDARGPFTRAVVSEAGTLSVTNNPSTLSGALVAAHRAIAGRDNAERAELVIVSPLLREQVDSATRALLALWPGDVRVTRVRRAAGTTDGDHEVEVRAVGDDPVAASLGSLASPTVTREAQTPARVRVLRGPGDAASAETAWARDSGGVLVLWPADLSSSTLPRRASIDSAQGIAAGPHVVVGNFARTHEPRPGHALVRWLDGQAAATERAFGTGCIRELAIPVDGAGDLVLRESFRGIVDVVTSPCGGAREVTPADVASLLPPAEARRTNAAIATVAYGRLGAWLALGALAILLVEQLLRRRQPA